MIKILYIFFIIVACRASEIIEYIIEGIMHKPTIEIFSTWHYLYKKGYDINSLEGRMRYKYFKKTIDYITSFNKENPSVKMGLNKFSDYTDDEYSQLVVPKNIVFETSNTNHLSAIPGTIDWSQYLTIPVSNQKICGCCWAMSTVSVIEANYKKKYGVDIKLSEQDLINCATQNDGCGGGDIGLSFKHVLNNGIAYYNALQFTSPSTGVSGVCNAGLQKNFVLNNYERGTTQAKMFELLIKGPVATYMDASSLAFRNYKSGVLTAAMLECKQITHAANVYGYDSAKGAYMVRNSFGKEWGMSGNYLLALDNNGSCFLERGVTWPDVKFTSNPVPPPLPLKCIEFFSQCLLSGTVYELCNGSTSIPVANRNMAGFLSNKYDGIPIILFTSERCQDPSYYKLTGSITCFSSQGLDEYINNVKSVAIETTSVPPNCIKVYDDSCLLGTSFDICSSSISSLAAIGWDRRISSIRFGSGIKKVTLYTNENFFGLFTSISIDSYGLQDSFNKKARSIKIN